MIRMFSLSFLMYQYFNANPQSEKLVIANEMETNRHATRKSQRELVNIHDKSFLLR